MNEGQENPSPDLGIVEFVTVLAITGILLGWSITVAKGLEQFPRVMDLIWGVALYRRFEWGGYSRWRGVLVGGIFVLGSYSVLGHRDATMIIALITIFIIPLLYVSNLRSGRRAALTKE